jgi:hypothetical protein
VSPLAGPTAPSAGYAGSVYLLHLERPLAGAQNQHGRPTSGHYIGWTARRSVGPRVALHSAGQSGSKYMRQALREGIGFNLVRVWRDVDRNFERSLKLRKCAARLCPQCRGE